jgi:hypothetical protein
MYPALKTLAVLVCAHFLAGSAMNPSHAQPLPQWLPIATLDKPFNDAAKDLNLPEFFTLHKCGNLNGGFICTYGSQTGVGLAAWSAQQVGLVEQINIGMPSCEQGEELAHISAMLLHIFHPRRPVSTIVRGIVAMAEPTTRSGANEHWLDDVSYLLVDRKMAGFGLIIRRKPPNATTPRPFAVNYRYARAQNFYLPPPPDSCIPPAEAIVVAPPVAPRPALKLK